MPVREKLYLSTRATFLSFVLASFSIVLTTEIPMIYTKVQRICT